MEINQKPGTDKTVRLAKMGMLVAVMVPANYFITSAFMGVSKSVIIQLMPFIMLFNLIKMSVNSLITFLLYKRISGFLHR